MYIYIIDIYMCVCVCVCVFKYVNLCKCVCREERVGNDKKIHIENNKEVINFHFLSFFSLLVVLCGKLSPGEISE